MIYSSGRRASLNLGYPEEKETELQFTRRLIKEDIKGVKGLAYVLTEIRRAIAEGIIKPVISPDQKKHGGISKFTNIFNKAASTKLHHTEKIKELTITLKEKTGRILEHLIKE